jgi:hypothetical protein
MGPLRNIPWKSGRRSRLVQRLGQEGGLAGYPITRSSVTKQEIDMENDIALIAAGYLLTRIGVLVAFGYLVYRVLRPTPAKARIETKREYSRVGSNPARLDR